MKTLTKSLILCIALAGYLVASYVVVEPKHESVVIHTDTIDKSFDEALMNGLETLYRYTTRYAWGFIHIDMGNTDVVAQVKIIDLKLLADKKISCCDFIRDYVVFI